MFSVLFPKSWRGQQLAKPPSDEVVNGLSMSCYSFTASRYRRQIVVPTELRWIVMSTDAVRSTELGWIFATNNKLLSSAVLCCEIFAKMEDQMMTKFWHSRENRRCTTTCRYWKLYYSFEIIIMYEVWALSSKHFGITLSLYTGQQCLSGVSVRPLKKKILFDLTFCMCHKYGIFWRNLITVHYSVSLSCRNPQGMSLKKKLNKNGKKYFTHLLFCAGDPRGISQIQSVKKKPSCKKVQASH